MALQAPSFLFPEKGKATGLEALEWQGMGAAGSPESLPLLPTVLAADCGCGGRDSKTKMHFNSLACHVLSNYCKIFIVGCGEM